MYPDSVRNVPLQSVQVPVTLNLGGKSFGPKISLDDKMLPGLQITWDRLADVVWIQYQGRLAVWPFSATQGAIPLSYVPNVGSSKIPEASTVSEFIEKVPASAVEEILSASAAAIEASPPPPAPPSLKKQPQFKAKQPKSAQTSNPTKDVQNK